MNRAQMIIATTAALAGTSGIHPLATIAGPRRRAQKESIDDVLSRAKARQGKGWFDPKLDGRVRPLDEGDFNELSLSRMPPGVIRVR